MNNQSEETSRPWKVAIRLKYANQTTTQHSLSHYGNVTPKKKGNLRINLWRHPLRVLHMLCLCPMWGLRTTPGRHRDNGHRASRILTHAHANPASGMPLPRQVHGYALIHTNFQFTNNVGYVIKRKPHELTTLTIAGQPISVPTRYFTILQARDNQFCKVLHLPR